MATIFSCQLVGRGNQNCDEGGGTVEAAFFTGDDEDESNSPEEEDEWYIWLILIFVLFLDLNGHSKFSDWRR